MAGRKTKLSQQLIKQAEKLLKGGNYVNTVCTYLGISERTWYNWFNEGEQGFEQGKNNLKVQFFQSVKMSEAEAEIRMVTELQKIAERDDKWQALAWMLERKYADRWGRKERLDANLYHSGKDGGPIETQTKINLSNLSDEELAVLEGIVAKSAEPEPD